MENNPVIQIIGLPAAFDRLPVFAAEAVKNAKIVVLQSGRCGAAEEIKKIAETLETLDGLFEDAADFDALYERGARRILRLSEGGRLVFCALGDVYANGFVRALQKEGDPDVIFGASPAAEAVFLAGRLVGDIGGYHAVDARALPDARIDTSCALVVTGVDAPFTAADTRLLLLEYYAPDEKAVYVAGGHAAYGPLADLERMFGAEREGGSGDVSVVLSALELSRKKAFSYFDLVDIMERLRGKDGCPWDREQTHKSLRPYLIEEAYEVMEAVDDDDADALYDELGDVLLQVVFHAEIARQCGEFTERDVTSAVCAKLIRRHPHIFGGGKADTAGEVRANWEEIKRGEKGNDTYASVLRDVPKTMGAVQRAFKIQKKAANAGFDWPDALGAYEKVKEETEEFFAEAQKGDAERAEQEAGDLLFALVNVLRKLKINPEVALARTCEKFVNRFSQMEKDAAADMKDLSLDELETLWQKSKSIFP